MPDLILRGGRVYDGSGALPYRADVAISAGRIEDIGTLEGAEATAVIDIQGLAIAPGFVDVHSHTDLTAFLPDEHNHVKVAGLLQGVTTEVCGNCGASAFPLRPDAQNDPYLGALSGGQDLEFDDLAQYREGVARRRLAANLAPLVGHGTIRAAAMGPADRAPTDEELKRMRALTAEAMEQGAFGLSTGLIYAPGMFSQTEEIIALAGEVRRYHRPYTTHMRDEGDRVEEAIEEAIRIAREGGVALQVSHHKIGGRRNWGRSAQTLAQLEGARRSGVDVTIDAYPYTAGSTFLAAVLPPWALDGGPGRALERVRDAAALERMKRDIETGLPRWQNLAELAGWNQVVVAGEPPHAGRSIGQIAADDGRHPLEVVADLLVVQPATLIIIHMMDSAEVETIIDQPFAMVGSDGIPLPGQQHPRLAGSFARVLSRHGKDDATLADAIRRMTSLPCQRFSIPRRGSVTKGYTADLVVFDPATVKDGATYQDPFLPPEGVRHVFLGGAHVVRDGAFTDTWSGRVLEPAS